MKINYTFANGETSDVEVREEIGNLILDSRREESNQDRKERYHCYSLDAAEYEGEDYADGSTPETELFLQLENQRIKEAFGQLSEVQRRRLLMFHVPVEKHGVNGHLRQKGKQAELACIAEGQLVLTDKGLVPIESVTTNHKLWDGESWVKHEGVIYKGEREVIEYGHQQI